jgi:phage portal protein BeeE
MPGLSFDGLTGYSPIALAKNAIGLTRRPSSSAHRSFGRGSTPTGVLETSENAQAGGTGESA